MAAGRRASGSGTGRPRGVARVHAVNTAGYLTALPVDVAWPRAGIAPRHDSRDGPPPWVVGARCCSRHHCGLESWWAGASTRPWQRWGWCLPCPSASSERAHAAVSASLCWSPPWRSPASPVEGRAKHGSPDPRPISTVIPLLGGTRDGSWIIRGARPTSRLPWSRSTVPWGRCRRAPASACDCRRRATSSGAIARSCSPRSTSPRWPATRVVARRGAPHTPTGSWRRGEP